MFWRAIHCSSVVNKASLSCILCCVWPLLMVWIWSLSWNASPVTLFTFSYHHCIDGCWRKTAASHLLTMKSAMSYLTGRRVFVPPLWKLIMSGYFLTGSMSIPRSGWALTRPMLHSYSWALIPSMASSASGLWSLLNSSFLSPCPSPPSPSLSLFLSEVFAVAFEKCHN